jgi:hypothetical protein
MTKLRIPKTGRMRRYLRRWDERMLKKKGPPPMYSSWLEYLYAEKYRESHGARPEDWPMEPDMALVITASRMLEE